MKEACDFARRLRLTPPDMAASVKFRERLVSLELPFTLAFVNLRRRHRARRRNGPGRREEFEGPAELKT